MASLMNDRIATQRAEFDAVQELSTAYTRITRTPIVDDYYPEVRHGYETMLYELIKALVANGRFDPDTHGRSYLPKLTPAIEEGRAWVDCNLTVKLHPGSSTIRSCNDKWHFKLVTEKGEIHLMDVPLYTSNTFTLNGVRVLLVTAGG